MKTTLKNIILLAAVAALSACGNSNKEPKETEFNLMCDESVENIIRQEVQVYELKYPDVRIHAHYVDEKAIDDSIMNLTRGVYITATEMTYERRRFLEANHRNTYCVPVAVDAIAVITHTGNDIAELSIQQLSDILTGKTKNWNEISPSKLGDISVVFDNQNSSTVKYMMQNVTNRKPFCKNVYAQKTNKDVFEMVRTHKNAIGIIGVSWLSRDLNNIAIVANYSKSELNEMETAAEVNHDMYSEQTEADYSQAIKVVPIRKNDSPYAYKPYQYDIYTGNYPLFRTIYAVCTSPTSSKQHAFCRFITSIPGQKVILNTGVMPANVPPQRAVVIEN